MSDLVIDIANALYKTKYPARHHLVLKVSHLAFQNLKRFACQFGTSPFYWNYQFLGTPVLVDHSAEGETWEVLVVLDNREKNTVSNETIDMFGKE